MKQKRRIFSRTYLAGTCKTTFLTLMLGVLGLALSCSSKKTDPAAQSTESAQNVASSGTSSDQTAHHLTQFVLSELQHLKEGIPLDEWKKLHANDTLEIYSYWLAYTNGNWCARMSSEVLFDSNRKIERVAYFYLPPQTDPPLPSMEVQPEKIIGQCRLGFLWTAVENTDAKSEDAIVDGVRKSIAARMGTGEFDLKFQWMGSAGWRKTALWESGGLSVATAIRYGIANRVDKSPLIFVGASAENSGIGFLTGARTKTSEHDAFVAQRKIIWSRIEEAMTISGVSGAEGAEFRTALRIIEDSEGWFSRSPTASERSSILNALDLWLTAARTLPSTRQSAALFAADQLLQESGGVGWNREESPTIRLRLETQGAKFRWLELGGGYEYTHEWLKEALQLDPDGRPGELAFVTLMERGFETSRQCVDQHGEGFRAVIAKGEDYLRRKPSSPILSDIHFMMAQAYGDIVNLATGGGPDGPDLKLQPEEAMARIHAIEHYRLAFKSGSNTPRARAIWPEAWRLVAGLPPTRLYFFCYYD